MRSIFWTDYSNQSFKNIKDDLREWQSKLKEDIKQSQNYLNKLENNWASMGYDNFVVIARECKILLDTALDDISVVLSEIDEEVKEYQVITLNRIGKKAVEYNNRIGIIKNSRTLQEGAEYDYYCYLRDSIINLQDLTTLSKRLEDFVGKKKKHIN